MPLNKNDLRKLAGGYYNMNMPDSASRQDLLTLLYKESELRGEGFGDFMRGLTTGAYNIIKKGVNTAKRITRLNPEKVLNYRTQYTRATSNTLKDLGDQVIADITIIRTPVSNAFITALNTMSFGLFRDLMKRDGFDKMFHLALLLNINGKRIVVEKLAEINITSNYNASYDKNTTEALQLTQYRKNIKLNTMMKATQDYMGNASYFDYDAFTNNCQVFIMSILHANGLLDATAREFIFQDIGELFSSLQQKAPYLTTIAKASTRLGALWNRITGKGVVSKKTYPLNYGTDAEAIINTMAFEPSKVAVLGSMAIKATLYPSDFDLFETVKVDSVKQLAKEFQLKISTLKNMEGVFIGDMKIGENKEFKVVNDKAYYKAGKVIGSSSKQTRERLRRLSKDLVITPEELSQAMALVKDNPTEKQWNEMKSKLRYHVLRWSVDEVEAGIKSIGIHKITIQDAIKSDGVFKLDVIGLTDNKYMDYSIIYDIRDKKTGTRINSFQVNVKDNLKDAIQTYMDEGEYFKALKRRYSLLKYKYSYTKTDKKETWLKQMTELTNFFNSDVGILTSVRNDCLTLLELYEIKPDNLHDETILKMLNSFIYRLSNVYSVNTFMKKEGSILKTIKEALKNPKDIPHVLEKLSNKLKTMMNTEAKHFCTKNNMMD